MKVRGTLKVTKNLILTNPNGTTGSQGLVALSDDNGSVSWGHFYVLDVNESLTYKKGTIVMVGQEAHIAITEDAPGTLPLNTDNWLDLGGSGTGGTDLTQAQLDAINGANSPSSSNVFATAADIHNLTILGTDTIANILLKDATTPNNIWITSTAGVDSLGNIVAEGDGLVSDGTRWYTVGLMRGPEGPPGPTGDQGIKGDPGAGIDLRGTESVVNILAKDPGTDGETWIASDTGVDDYGNPVLSGDGLMSNGTGWENIGAIRGPAGDTVYSGTYLIEGGISWIQDYMYNVRADQYVIAGDVYSATQQDIVLSPADATFNRIDVFMAGVDGTLMVLQGIPALSPVKPEVNESLYCPISFVMIEAATTEPSEILDNAIYDENLGVAGGEWDAAVLTSNGAFIDLDYNGDYFTGAKSIRVQNARNEKISFSIDPATLALNSEVDVFKLRIKSLSASTNANITVRPFNGPNKVGSSLNVADFGYNYTNITAWQLVTFNLDDFVPTDSNIDSLQIVIEAYTPTAFANILIDSFSYQSGLNIIDNKPLEYTSSLVNDGDDGLNPFIDLTDIYPNNTLIDGGYYHVANYDYFVWASRYIIDGVTYNEYISDTVTLSPAHATLKRIDIIVINDNGVISVVEGTPASNPTAPSIDTTTQLEVTFILVVENTTEPGDIFNEQVYEENQGEPNEWSLISASASVNPDNVSDSSKGIRSISFTASPIYDFIKYQNDAPIIPDGTGNLIFKIKFVNLVAHRIKIFITDAATGDNYQTWITPTNFYGIDTSNTSDWQTCTVPTTRPYFLMTSFDTIEFINNKSGASFMIDDIYFQTGTEPVTPPTIAIDRTSQLINDGADSTSTFAEHDELGTVATSNSYNDLDDLPDPAVLTDVDSIQFNTAAAQLPSEPGLIQWNANEDTFDFHANGVTYQGGQLLSPLYRNDTGSTLAKGAPMMFAGASGISGRIKVQNAIADGSLPPFYTIGIATQDILTGEDGHVTWFGKAIELNTTGTPYGEVWNDADLLYVSPTTAGWLTNVKPEAPNLQISVAAVIYADATAGSLLIRPTWNSRLVDLDDVNGTPLIADGQIAIWHNTEKYFDFDKNINNYALLTDIPTLTSELTNDGSDTINPYISLAEVPNTDWNAVSGPEQLLNIPPDLVEDAAYVHTDNNYDAAAVQSVADSDAHILDATIHFTQAEISIPESQITFDEAYQVLSEKGQANGYASLDGTGLVPANQLPSYVDDVEEYADLASFPAVGEAGKLYVALDTNKVYRWSGTVYIHITSGAVDSVNGEVGVVVLDKTHIGLGNVENTADLDKVISTLTQAALDDKVDDSQVLTDVPSGALFTDTTYANTSEFVNDGDDGVNPFISATDLPTNTSDFVNDGNGDLDLAGDPLVFITADDVVIPASEQLDVSVDWVTGLTFDVRADRFPIAGEWYSATQANVVLTNGDATFNRIDLFVANSAGTVGKITGVASTNPVEPNYDAATQYPIRFILVEAGLTAISGYTKDTVFDENVGEPGEWTFLPSGTAVVSTNNPHSGTNNVEATDSSQALFQNDITVGTSTMSVLTFWLELKSAYGKSNITINFKDGTSTLTSLTFKDGKNGFDGSSLIYQKISIDLEGAGLPAGSIDTIGIAFSKGGFTGFYIDEVELQYNITIIAPPVSGGHVTSTAQILNEGADSVSTYVEHDEIATVASTGSYNDLIDLPAIPGDAPIENSYADIAAMQADQGNQTSGFLQYVLDASADPAVTSGHAYYEYLGTTTGTLLIDYRKLSDSETFYLDSQAIAYKETPPEVPNGVITVFTTLNEAISAEFIWIYMDGVGRTDFTYNGATKEVTLGFVPDTGNAIVIQYITTLNNVGSPVSQALYGTTAQRVLATSTPIGESFWDTTLKMPCWLEIGVWYNAAGGEIL
jgi:hypothetical protein